MPRPSKTENVRKRCTCVKWKTCRHPWYLDYQQDTRRHRVNLDRFVGRHAVDFGEAKDEARRAIVAIQHDDDPKGLLPSDDPTLAAWLTEHDRDNPQQDRRWQVGRILQTDVGRRPFGEWRLSTITADTLKDFQRRRPKVAGNRDLALLRAAFNRAVLTGLVPASPFRKGEVATVKLQREEGRSRRLQPGEFDRLLAAARGLQALILAAIETGCRRGELLSLQWHQVRFTPRCEIFLPAQKTKAKQDRRMPISTVLRRLLEGRRLDPAGEMLPPDAYVFGDEIGRRRGSIKTAWRLVCQRAKIGDLHFHDLRREAGSRWMDAGIPLATIQRWLGHANIAQTSTYLGASLGGDEQDMQTYEARIGRDPLVTYCDVFSPPTPDPTTSNHPGAIENVRKNTKVH